ncbi:OLC1v1009194C1 [Oldenlandia corymbosa var. corymbosa]|uniref:OLC1v1009194C1 n=1 Tax=Oldenlandia corymbosa var. corymbosa TaxID=529605 RepID=A0AAV1DQQ8_OLDCO|nr:OLC1v1009194C1 [Oldenlandia corymbosa var. corymbosa]
MEEVHEEFNKISFNGSYTLGLMNPRHVLIHFEQKDDCQCCWIRTFWNIGGFSMRILKLTPGFRFEEDPPVVPIWVSLYDLPIEFMHPEVIYSMATSLGQPLKVDTPTLNMTSPFVVRFCVEVDLTKDLPKSVRVGKKGRKHEQLFTFEHVPSYCVKCSKIGHKDSECRIGKSILRSDDVEPSLGKKKGIKLAPSKPKLALKRGNEKHGLDVDTLNLNPLIAKGIELVARESSGPSSPPAETLGARTLEAEVMETLEQRRVESTSGLTVKEKELTLINLQSSPKRNEVVPQYVVNPIPPQYENKFWCCKMWMMVMLNYL